MSGERITVECPGCGRCYQDWPGPVDLELELDPELADPGFLQSACTTTCPHCGRSACTGTLGAEQGVWRTS